MRTALSQFSFALIILKIFTSEFYPIGALFAVYGAAVMLVAIYRRYEGNRQFFDQEVEEDLEEPEHDVGHGGNELGVGTGFDNGQQVPQVDGLRPLERRKTVVVVKKKFRTSANSVALLTGLSFAAYVALMVLLWDLSQ